MPKAIISNRIFLEAPDAEHLKKIMRELTHKFHKNTGSKQFAVVETVKNYKVLPKGIISIPQGRLDLVPDNYEIIDKRIKVPVPFPDPIYPLRESQQPVYDEINDTAFINALVGWGKCFAL